MKGVFITFEGIEGSGKSTLSRMASEYLRQRGFSVVLTHEPGDTEAGRELRRVLLDPHLKGMHPLTELLLYFADRSEHVHRVIAPALRRGEVVVCDRFSDSTISYQGYGRGIDLDVLRYIDGISRMGLRPDLTILLDLDVREGLRRNSLTEKRDRFEQEDMAFHERVRRGYLRIAGEEPERVKVVDASRPIEVVFNEIRPHLERAVRKQSTS